MDVPAATAGEAVGTLGRQARISIGFRDPRLARMRVKPVRGRYTPAQALERLLAGTPARARRVASASFVIERAPARSYAPAVRPRPAEPAIEPSPAEIVVTATKRDVPLAAYAGGAQIVDGETLSVAEAARGTGLIETRAASVTSTHLGPGRNKLFIRGIADSSFVGPTQATVGQYWGNSRITYSAPDPSLRLYDVRSVEVLEGPQGTLYGAGSLGGVVRVVPNAPDLGSAGGNMWGGVQAIQHGDPGVDGGAILNLPLVEGRLGLRVLAFGGIDGGYIDDRERGLNDVNRVATIGGRAALRYRPDDDWTIDVTGLGQRIVGDDSQYADRFEDGLSRASTVAQPYRNVYWLGDVVVRKALGPVEWTSSIGYANQHVFEQFEGPRLADVTRLDMVPDAQAPPTAFTQNNRIAMVTAETRLARRGPDGTGWVIGASALRNRARVHRRMGEAATRELLTGVRNEVDETTLYGEYGVAPLADTTLTLGGRLTHSKLGGRSEDTLRSIALRVDPEAADTRSETRLLPSASLSWRPQAGTMVFARYQQGFRPGGIAVRRDFIQRFNGDRVETLEAGGRVEGDSVEAGITVSHTRWRNIQADIVDGFGFPTTANIGDGRVWSLGWSGRWRPAAGLEVDAALYLNDSRITDPALSILPLETGAIDRERLPNVADRSGRIGVRYSGRLGAAAGFDLAGYARYIGQSTLGIGSILGRLQGDYLDTGLELRIGDDRRGLSLTATNLLDARGNRFALGSPFLIRDEDQITPLQPRSIRIGFDAAF
ncbi:TonB-dependent receptor domain-containing protein [Sphingomonas sp. ac-8]|uniref:TonB-dependent receptor domain-containing protein n=1 Tax=Sphingomonas sp. ac-8 TaxID=3242977 RepID=UPI003A8088D7